MSDQKSIAEPTSYEKAILFGLQFKPMYGGTVDPVVVAERRAKNRAARRARRGNTAALIRQARLNRPRRGFAFRRAELPIAHSSHCPCGSVLEIRGELSADDYDAISEFDYAHQSCGGVA